jgi:FkbM family methyltransferase
LASRAWEVFLRNTGSYLDFPIQDETIRLSNQYRSLNLDYELETLATFLRALRPGDVVWDVGANIGLYTLLAGQKVGPGGRVIAWEPNPVTFQLLEKHLEANGLQERCRAIRGAIHDGGTAEVQFRLETQPTISRISLNAPEGAVEVVTVPARSLDAWCGELDRLPGVLKIDVEGAEVLVLRGAKRLLSGDLGPRPNLLVSVHPQFCKEFGTSTGEVEQLSRQLDYIALDVKGQPCRPVRYAEYWLVPHESCEQFREAVFPAGALAQRPAEQISPLPGTRI